MSAPTRDTDQAPLGATRPTPHAGFVAARAVSSCAAIASWVEHCNEARAAISGYSRVLDEPAAVRVALVRGGQSRFARIHYDELHCGDQRRVFQRQVRDL